MFVVGVTNTHGAPDLAAAHAVIASLAALDVTPDPLQDLGRMRVTWEGT